ncbi:MAG: hypothetical protein RL514_1655 [Verrucomicrobiota bacterium]|jgi:predicted RNase H-like HicB family nuclease
MGLTNAMKQTGYVYWQDGEMWLGYLEELPDYVTQGESLADLEAHLRDIYEDVTGGKIPQARRRAELAVA